MNSQISVPHILFVEDDDGYATTVKQILNDMRITHARTYEEALEFAKDLSVYDCALVDLNLVDNSDGRGRSVISVLRRNRKDLPVAALTAFEPREGATFETALREIGADDIVRKQGDPQHGITLRTTVDRLLDGELQPLVLRRVGAVLEQVAVIIQEWQNRQSEAEQWRQIVRRHYGSSRVPVLGDPFVRIAEYAKADLAAIQDDVSAQLGRRGSIDTINRARARLDSAVQKAQAAWVEAMAPPDKVKRTHRFAFWVSQFNFTVLIVLSGLLLSLSGGLVKSWRFDGNPISTAQVAVIVGGLVAGCSTAWLAGAGDKAHSRVREAWTKHSDAVGMEELLAATRMRPIIGASFLVLAGVVGSLVGVLMHR